MAKGKGMGYHGGKAKVGKKNLKHMSNDPREFQTRTETSKSQGIGYNPEGMKPGKC